jgi:hypothetical protein
MPASSFGEATVMDGSAKVPVRACVVTFAGAAVNLCLGILFAWSVLKKALVVVIDKIGVIIDKIGNRSDFHED